MDAAYFCGKCGKCGKMDLWAWVGHAALSRMKRRFEKGKKQKLGTPGTFLPS